MVQLASVTMNILAPTVVLVVDSILSLTIIPIAYVPSSAAITVDDGKSYERIQFDTS